MNGTRDQDPILASSFPPPPRQSGPWAQRARRWGPLVGTALLTFLLGLGLGAAFLGGDGTTLSVSVCPPVEPMATNDPPPAPAPSSGKKRSGGATTRASAGGGHF